MSTKVELIHPQKFIDGTPVPNDYLQTVSKMIAFAVEGDPGEEGEADVQSQRILP